LKIKQWDTAKVKPYENNPRINDDAVEKVARSLQEFGFRQPLVVDSDGVLVVGHTRLRAAESIGMSKVPVLVADDLTDDQINAYRIADNKTAEFAEWDFEALGSELENIDMDMSWLDFDLTGIEEDMQGETDEDAVPDAPEEPVSVRGEIYQLGEHRLMCGDSTSLEDVEALMGGEKADMVFTDPPYGVSYVGKTKDAMTIESDDFDEEKLEEVNRLWFDNVDSATRDGAILLATVPPGPLHLIFASDWKSRGWLRQIMVWNKSSMVLGHSEYHYKHEPILFGWKHGGDRHKNEDRTKTTVWDFDKPNASRLHPTMKPVEMWVYGISNHTEVGDTVYEPFGGSGTTVMACEKIKRKARLMELDPKYCDVIRKRWAEFVHGEGCDWQELTKVA
jgi:site-specific DNA-methyltransferase (adenine-specific)